MLEKDSKKVVLLTSRVSSDDPLDPDSTIDYINDVAVASNGIVYFTDSVQGIMPRRNYQGFWDTMEAYMLTLFQVSRMLRFARPHSHIDYVDDVTGAPTTSSAWKTWFWASCPGASGRCAWTQWRPTC